MRWHPDKRRETKGHWTCAVRARAKNRADYYRNREKRLKVVAKYKAANREHYLAYWRNRSRVQNGWYDEGGMATKPTQLKEITNV